MTEQPATISTPQYRIMFTKEAARIFWYLIDKAPGEISMLGSVIKTGMVFRVTEIHFKGLKQRNTQTSTEILPQAIDKFIVDREMAGLNNGDLRGSFHSHGNLQTFWSGTDDTNIERFEYCPWLVSVVVNKRKEVLGRIDIFNPLRVTIDHVQVGIEEEIFSKDLQTQLDEGYKETVEEQFITEYPVTTGQGSHYPGIPEANHYPGANGNGGRGVSRREMERARALRAIDEAAFGEAEFDGNRTEDIPGDVGVTKKLLHSVLDVIDTNKKDLVILENKVAFLLQGKQISEEVEDMMSRYTGECLDVLEGAETEFNIYLENMDEDNKLQESFSFGDRLT